MLPAEHLTQIWKQIVALEAECELTLRWRERIVIERGPNSPEALAAGYRLKEVQEQLEQMDKEYADFLKSGSWNWE